MCPIIPLHKQFFKSSGGSLRAVFIFSADLVPFYVNRCTCLICIAIVELLYVGVVFKTHMFSTEYEMCFCHAEREEI